MTATSQTLKREMNDLVLEQIFAFKEPTGLKGRQLLDYHLRHFRIMILYRELDRVGWERGSGTGSVAAAQAASVSSEY